MISDISQFAAEFVGTMILIILGNGVVAGVLLKDSKSHGSGWILITLAWGLAVAIAIYAVGEFSGAHINPAVTLGLASVGAFPWEHVPFYLLGQFAGAITGAAVVYLHYLPHWRRTEDPALKLAVHCTAPAIRRTWANLLSEVIGTVILLLGILAIGANKFTEGLNPLVIGGLVVAIGMSLGGPTGYAINPARDLGPRIAHAFLPIHGKGSSDWRYSWIPVAGPVIGGVFGSVFYKAVFFGEFPVVFWVTSGLVLVIAGLAVREEMVREA